MKSEFQYGESEGVWFNSRCGVSVVVFAVGLYSDEENIAVGSKFHCGESNGERSKFRSGVSLAVREVRGDSGKESFSSGFRRPRVWWRSFWRKILWYWV